MLNVNNKNTYFTLLSSVSIVNFGTYSTLFPSISIVDFEKVNIGLS